MRSYVLKRVAQIYPFWTATQSWWWISFLKRQIKEGPKKSVSFSTFKNMAKCQEIIHELSRQKVYICTKLGSLTLPIRMVRCLHALVLQVDSLPKTTQKKPLKVENRAFLLVLPKIWRSVKESFMNYLAKKCILVHSLVALQYSGMVRCLHALVLQVLSTQARHVIKHALSQVSAPASVWPHRPNQRPVYTTA